MERLSSLLALVAGCLIAVILVVMVLDVSRRNLTGGSVAGAYEVITMLLVGVVFLGLAQAERTDSMIKLTLVTSRLPASAALLVRTVANVVALLMCSWLVWATSVTARHSIERGEYQQGLLSIPTWPAKVVITLGLVVLVMEMALGLRRAWIGRADGR